MPKTKSGPLSKVEAYYIDGHFDELDASEIAEDLNRSIRSVENYIKKNHRKTRPQTGMEAGQHFIRQKGVTIMSENASTISDANKKRGPIGSQKCITKITDND